MDNIYLYIYIKSYLYDLGFRAPTLNPIGPNSSTLVSVVTEDVALPKQLEAA